MPIRNNRLSPPLTALPVTLRLALLPLLAMLGSCGPAEAPPQPSTEPTVSVAAPTRTALTTLPAPLGDPGPSVELAAYGEDNHYISRNEYRINPGFLNEKVLHLGDGVDMSNPDAPGRRSGLNPLKVPAPLRAGPGVSDYTLDQSFDYKEASSASEEAGILSAYFQGSYQFVSADAAYRKAVEERSNSTSVYVLLQEVGYTESITDLLHDQQLRWDPAVRPLFEGVRTTVPKKFRRQFVTDFGSHYVSAIEYGFRLAIRGRIKNTAKKEAQDIKAAFKATFAGGGAAGGVDAETRKQLSSSSLELTLVATSGGFVYDGEVRTPVLTGLDDILETLKELRSGTLKIRGAPLSAIVQTYWNRLPAEFEMSRALLADHGEPPRPPATYGVPAGTVIAWRPPQSAIHTDTAGKQFLIPPPGWALCDGSGGTPDLRQRFVFGTTAVAQIGKAGGSDSHRHSATVTANTSTVSKKTGQNFSKAIDFAAPDHSHGITVAETETLPPFVRLAFIIKI